MTTIHEIRTPEELSALGDEWSQLWSATTGATFFQTLPWLLSYWRHYGAGQRLKTLCVRQDGQLTGVLPLVIRGEASWLGPVRVLTYPLDYWGSFYGPLGANTAATLRSALDYLANAPRDWDVVDLRWIDADGRDAGQTQAAFEGAHWACQCMSHAIVPMIDLSAGWDAYWASRKSRFRCEASRVARRLAQRGTVRLVRHRPAGAAHEQADPRWDLYDDCVQVARRSHHVLGDNGVGLTHPRGGPLLRELHAEAVRLGLVDVCLLYVDDRPVAFNYNYLHQGYVCGLRRAFDPSCSDGAGTTLMWRMLEDGAARGDQTVDLGPDYLQTKRYWQSFQRHSYRYLYYPRSNPRAQALHLGRWVRQHLEKRRAPLARR